MRMIIFWGAMYILSLVFLAHTISSGVQQVMKEKCPEGLAYCVGSWVSEFDKGRGDG